MSTKVKSFKETAESKKFTTEKEVRDYLEGKKITILNINGGHNYGRTGEVIKFNNLNGCYINNLGATTVSPSIDNGSKSRNNILFSQFSVEGGDDSSKEELETQQKEINAEIEEMRAKIKDITMKLSFMKVNGLKSFDEDEFSVYKALTILEDTSTSKMEKVKVLAKLMKKK